MTNPLTASEPHSTEQSSATRTNSRAFGASNDSFGQSKPASNPRPISTRLLPTKRRSLPHSTVVPSSTTDPGSSHFSEFGTEEKFAARVHSPKGYPLPPSNPAVAFQSYCQATAVAFDSNRISDHGFLETPLR